ncbi:MAG: FecR domain-containing protein [Verrucomicrobiia bacterium]|jgi:hypothetical protein
MNTICRSKPLTFGGILAAGLMLMASPAQAKVNYAMVKRVVGQATYTSPAGSGALTSKMQLFQGSRITTGPDSFVDVDLGVNGDALRIEASSTVSLTMLTSRQVSSRQTVVNTEMNVTRGHVVANVVRKLSRASRYNIRTPSGVAGIRGTCIQAGVSGTIALIGQVTFVPTAGGGVRIIIPGFVMTAGANQPVRASLVQVSGVAQSAVGSTASAGTSAMVSQSVQSFAAAIASMASQAAATSVANGTPAQQAAAISSAASQAVNQLIPQLVAAVQAAAANAPPEIRAQVQYAAQVLAAQAAGMAQTVAGAVAGTVALNSGLNTAQAQGAAQGATNASSVPNADGSAAPPATAPVAQAAAPNGPNGPAIPTIPTPPVPPEIPVPDSVVTPAPPVTPPAPPTPAPVVTGILGTTTAGAK